MPEGTQLYITEFSSTKCPGLWPIDYMYFCNNRLDLLPLTEEKMSKREALAALV